LNFVIEVVAQVVTDFGRIAAPPTLIQDKRKRGNEEKNLSEVVLNRANWSHVVNNE
jgi:hypothetical protein